MTDFINNLFRVAGAELRHLRLNLMYVIALTITGMISILIFQPSVSKCYWIILVPWLVSGFFLFSTVRLIRIHVTGEALELLQASMSILSRALTSLAELTLPVARVPAVTPVPVATGNTGAFDNPFIRFYLRAISGVFLVQTSLFLILPLYVNYTMGGATAVILIAMLLTIVAIDNLAYFKRLSRAIVKTTVVVCTVGLVFVLFPHTGFYLSGITNKLNVISMSAAKKANDIDELRRKQQEKIDNDFLDGVMAWQAAHPGEKLPVEYQESLDKARRLGTLKSSS